MQVLHFVPSFVARRPDEVRRIVVEAAARRAGVEVDVRVLP
ncbi:hypothetical protein [Catellatospora tritici]|nr:hypothetical protein [Catellatospora tritici]